MKLLDYKINIEFIQIKSPPYSPDLNRIEMMWADLEQHVRKRLFTSINEVMEAVKDLMSK